MTASLDSIFVSLKQWIVGWIGQILPDWAPVLASIFISVITLTLLAPFLMMYLTLLERKVLGRMQNRLGPNRVGPWGLLQPVADGIKMLTKEDIVPRNADAAVHLLAPVLIIVPALLVFAVIPFGRNMTAADLNVGVLFFLALSSTTTIMIFMASWGSRNKFSVLGGMRTVAQMISYEIPMVLAVIPVLFEAGSLSTGKIVESQTGLWFCFTPAGLVSFLIFFLCAIAECNRTPFDLPEAESEFVAGFHTEYTGMKFALFYMAEYMNVVTISALTATLFLGGWQGPWLPSWLWIALKIFVLVFIMLWLRGTLPRFRIDQLMGLAWKFLMPLALLNVLAAGYAHFLETPWKQAFPAAVMILAFAVLNHLNRGYAPEKRHYRLEA